MKVCDETCIFFFFAIINKYFLMAKRSLLSRCPSCKGLSAVTALNTADLLHRTCIKIECHFCCTVDNIRPLRPSLRSAGRSISVNIRPLKWEMGSQHFESRSTSLCGRQIDASFAFNAKGREASGPVDAGPSLGLRRQLHPSVCPQYHLTSRPVHHSSDSVWGIFDTFQGDADAQ